MKTMETVIRPVSGHLTWGVKSNNTIVAAFGLEESAATFIAAARAINPAINWTVVSIENPLPTDEESERVISQLLLNYDDMETTSVVRAALFAYDAWFRAAIAHAKQGGA
jgi:hypothetical protein